MDESKGWHAAAVARTVSARWWAVLPVTTTLLVVVLHWTVQLQQSPPAVGDDAALFLYTGRELVEGRVVYQQIWDIKPPAVHELSAIAAVVAGGDPVVHYLLVASTTVLVASAIPGLLAVVAHRLTGSTRASLVAGLGPLVYPPFVRFAAQGVRPKYFTCALGLLSIYLYIEERPTGAIVAATLSAGFWQLGALFPIGVLAGLRFERGAAVDRVAKTAVVAVVVSLVVVAPIAVRGALGPMFVQVVVAPLITTEPGTMLDHWYRLRSFTGLSIVFVASGVYGALLTASEDRPPGSWWIPAGIGWFLLQVLQFDLDGPPDVIPLVVFCGLGVAVVTARLDAGRGAGIRPTDGSVYVLFLVGLLLVVSLPVTGLPPAADVDQNEAERAFWTDTSVPRCHVQLSRTEQMWIDRTPAEREDVGCWTPSWRDIVARVGP
jgi:hypothetical protein